MPALLLVLSGCGAEDSGETVAEKPAVAFEGKTDPQYVALWKTPDGKISYDLKSDGTYVLKGKASTPAGPKDYSLKGEWKVGPDRFLFRDDAGNVVPYKYVLKGDRLTLSLTGSMKNETVLVKQ